MVDSEHHSVKSPAKAGSVRLRGVTVPLDSDVGQTFVADCCRHTEGLLCDSDLKTKWKLTEEDWVGLAANTLLLDTVKTERERRVFNGVAAREGHSDILPRRLLSSKTFLPMNGFRHATASKPRENYAKPPAMDQMPCRWQGSGLSSRLI